ncbi:transcriptional repressor [Oricola sp.]|uniref:transcriptional repressor n=1 Tax=Oricola sp. TaxID=1979950 RepID=UPI003BA93D47
MTNQANSKLTLTRNQALVLKTLEAAGGPLTAYNILDRLTDEGLRAPPQVYRALEKLLACGTVHRLESLNAFVACSHPGCQEHATVAFTICEDCGQVTELADGGLASTLRKLTSSTGFSPRKTTIEIRGLCDSCSDR